MPRGAGEGVWITAPSSLCFRMFSSLEMLPELNSVTNLKLTAFVVSGLLSSHSVQLVHGAEMPANGRSRLPAGTLRLLTSGCENRLRAALRRLFSCVVHPRLASFFFLCGEKGYFNGGHDLQVCWSSWKESAV